MGIEELLELDPGGSDAVPVETTEREVTTR
jgi:hypothetical protein